MCLLVQLNANKFEWSNFLVLITYRNCMICLPIWVFNSDGDGCCHLIVFSGLISTSVLNRPNEHGLRTTCICLYCFWVSVVLALEVLRRHFPPSICCFYPQGWPRQVVKLLACIIVSFRMKTTWPHSLPLKFMIEKYFPIEQSYECY